jgi:predicted nucleic acid-binding protein
LTVAYVDTSVVLAILFEEPRAGRLRTLIGRYEQRLSSDLLVAEATAAAAREGVELDSVLVALEAISLILPSRSLLPEIRRTLAIGALRGADLWHLACALFAVGTDPGGVAFVTRDERQRRVARDLGFATP